MISPSPTGRRLLSSLAIFAVGMLNAFAALTAGTADYAWPVNFTLFSLEEPQSVWEIAMLSRAAGISGLMSKPPGGFVSARMNSRQGQRHRRIERQADAKTNPSVKNAGWRLEGAPP